MPSVFLSPRETSTYSYRWIDHELQMEVAQWLTRISGPGDGVWEAGVREFESILEQVFSACKGEERLGMA